MLPDKNIKSLLEQLSSGKPKDSFYFVTRKLAEHIDLAKIWLQDANNTPIDLYLLKEGKNYVGAIQQKESELFVYTYPSVRRTGKMKAALIETVLPHLLQTIPIIRVTLNRSILSEKMYIAGKKLALHVGFEILQEESGRCRLLMDGTKLQKRIFIQGENFPLTFVEKEEIKKLIIHANLYTSISHSMLEYREGRSPLSEELLEVSQQIQRIQGKM